MGQIISKYTCKEPLFDEDGLLIETYKNWIDCLCYDEHSSEDSIFRILHAIDITDQTLIKRHIFNLETKIRTPSDFVASRVVNMLTGRERLIFLKPWGFYKLRESNIRDTFILSDLDEIENIASNDDHIFWTILRLVNRIETINITIDMSQPGFWIKMCLLTNNLELATKISSYLDINLYNYEGFRDKYSPIDIPLVSNTMDTE